MRQRSKRSGGGAGLSEASEAHNQGRPRPQPEHGQRQLDGAHPWQVIKFDWGHIGRYPPQRPPGLLPGILLSLPSPLPADPPPLPHTASLAPRARAIFPATPVYPGHCPSAATDLDVVVPTNTPSRFSPSSLHASRQPHPSLTPSSSPARFAPDDALRVSVVVATMTLRLRLPSAPLGLPPPRRSLRAVAPSHRTHRNHPQARRDRRGGARARTLFSWHVPLPTLSARRVLWSAHRSVSPLLYASPAIPAFFPDLAFQPRPPLPREAPFIPFPSRRCPPAYQLPSSPDNRSPSKIRLTPRTLTSPSSPLFRPHPCFWPTRYSSLPLLQVLWTPLAKGRFYLLRYTRGRGAFLGCRKGRLKYPRRVPGGEPLFRVVFTLAFCPFPSGETHVYSGRFQRPTKVAKFPLSPALFELIIFLCSRLSRLPSRPFWLLTRPVCAGENSPFWVCPPPASDLSPCFSSFSTRSASAA